jgi:hypothetical protein
MVAQIVCAESNAHPSVPLAKRIAPNDDGFWPEDGAGAT